MMKKNKARYYHVNIDIIWGGCVYCLCEGSVLSEDSVHFLSQDRELAKGLWILDKVRQG